MNAQIKIFHSASELTDSLADTFCSHITRLCRMKSIITIALSGGNTPQLWFKRIVSASQQSGHNAEWDKVHFFWCDERCVPPQHPESNFGMANRYMLRALNINECNVHRIQGENKPEIEVIRYNEEIRQNVYMQHKVPVFDWIFLGMGDDGHTASIFPDQLPLLYSDSICAVAVHPQTGQNRITLTGKPINNADRITFLITGRSKSQRIKEILADEPVAKQYPARYIKPIRGMLEWYLDKEAAALI